MAHFLNTLKTEDITDKVWRLTDQLVYVSDICGTVIVPKGFYTDLASVPRIPIVFMLWGDRSHHEAVVHDYLYRIDSVPNVSETIANEVFYEAMRARGKGKLVSLPMFWGVCLGGKSSYHKMKVNAVLR